MYITGAALGPACPAAAQPRPRRYGHTPQTSSREAGVGARWWWRTIASPPALADLKKSASEQLKRSCANRTPDAQILDTNPNGLKIPREALLPKPPEEYEQRLTRPSIGSSKWN